ncbi:MAG: hypothetical protein FWD78_02525 [Treponema sp.]|nr:hypothetical protein [Treponema sp.]
MKRKMSFILAAVLMLAPGWGGAMLMASGNAAQSTGQTSASAANVNPAGVLPIVKNKINLSVFAEVDASIQNLEENAAIKRLESETNIHIDVTARPSNNNDVVIQRNLLLASGDYPEVFMMIDRGAFTQVEMIQYGMKDKIFIPLNNLIDKYGYELKQIFEYNPDFKNIMVMPDNNIYAITRIAEVFHTWAYPKYWVNQSWLNQLNIATPKTIEDYYNMLKTIKNGKPDGQANPIPVTTNTNATLDLYVMNAYMPYNRASNYCYLDDNNKIVFAPGLPEFREGLRFLNKIYTEGLLDPSAFTQTQEQMQQSIRQEVFLVGGYLADHMTQGVDGNNVKAMAAYTALTPVKATEKGGWQSSVSRINYNMNGYYLITDKCKNPEAAFRLADYFSNEETFDYKANGQEGLDWKKPDVPTLNMAGGPFKVMPLTITDPELLRTALNRRFNVGNLRGIKEVRDSWQRLVSGDDLNLPAYYESRLQVETAKVFPYFYPKELSAALMLDENEMVEYSNINTNLRNHVIRSVAQFTVGDRSIDRDWDAYLNELKNFKLDRFLELYQKSYDRFKSIK